MCVRTWIGNVLFTDRSLKSIMATITEEKPPYKPYGRYVCDWDCRELHLFNTVVEARKFAQAWDRNCNVGWLAPVLSRKTGQSRKPTTFEARKQISFGAACTDHRSETGVLTV